MSHEAIYKITEFAAAGYLAIRIIFLRQPLVRICVEYPFHMCLSGRKGFEAKSLDSIAQLLIFPSEKPLLEIVINVRSRLILEFTATRGKLIPVYPSIKYILLNNTSVVHSAVQLQSQSQLLFPWQQSCHPDEVHVVTKEPVFFSLITSLLHRSVCIAAEPLYTLKVCLLSLPVHLYWFVS